MTNVIRPKASTRRTPILVGIAALCASSACADRPPPRTWALDRANGSAQAPAGGAEPEALDEAEAAYPGPAYATGPVVLEPGAGAALPLERYIVVDQFGYLPEARKVAVLADPKFGWNAADRYTPPAKLELRRWSDSKVVHTGPARKWNGGAVDATAGDRGAWFDFSAVREPGRYFVFDPALKLRSHAFVIGKDVYRPVLRAALKMYYFNRANFEKKPPHSCYGKRCWSLGSDNLGPGQDGEARSVRAREDKRTARDLRGGWWDAGDTNKYTTFTNEPVHQLLSAYTENPSAFGDDVGIPESGNGVPDVVDEILVELAWLKRMQASDLKGGALLKVGNVDHPTELPDRSRLPRYYYPDACSSATITVAGVFAHAALVLRRIPTLSREAEELERRASDAWLAYGRLPKREDCDDGTIKSGDADVTISIQQQLAVNAAVYLFALTGAPGYDLFVQQHFRETLPFKDNTWSLYQPSQGDALLVYSTLPNAHAPTKQAILERVRSLSKTEEGFGFRPELDLYRAFMRPDSYHWGSNNQRASYGNSNMSLLAYGVVEGSAAATFRERAAGLLHSFHGVNPMQLVYLSNMFALGAEESVSEIYHNWFKDLDPLWDSAHTSAFGPAPGYVVGGPNAQYCAHQSPDNACVNSPARRQPPEKSYIDTNTAWQPQNPYDKSWEWSEPGIYYQASYVRLVSKF